LPEAAATASAAAVTVGRAPPALWTPPAAAVWAIFGALLVAVGIMLLRGCAIGLPYALTGWILNYCPGSADSGALAALAAERAKQTTLQAEYDELVRQAELKRQACFIQKPKPPDPKPPEPKPPEPKPEPQQPEPKPSEPTKPVMTIPTTPNKENPLDFIKGCWVAHDNLQEIVGGKETGQTVIVTLCFNADGTGSRTIKYNQDGSVCRGAIRAHLDGENLTIDLDNAICDGPHGTFNSARAVCRRAPNGEAHCDETGEGASKPDFTDFPFTRVDQQ
jgi:hypothetical protein